MGEKFILNGEKINGIQVFVDDEEIYEFKSEVKNNSIKKIKVDSDESTFVHNF